VKEYHSQYLETPEEKARQNKVIEALKSKGFNMIASKSDAGLVHVYLNSASIPFCYGT
jgi:hypothetical protein